MRKMNLIATMFLLVSAFVIPSGIAPSHPEVSQYPVQESELPDAGITPDSFLYGFKRFFEKTDIFFTFGDSAKVEKHLHYAELRLSELVAMAGKGKIELSDRSSIDYESELFKAITIIDGIKDSSRKETLAGRASETTASHLDALDRVQKLIPEPEERLSATRSRVIESNQGALKLLASENPEKASEIFVNLTLGRIDKIKHASDEGDANGTIRATEEYDKYSNFGQEISSIAQQVGKNSSKVDELVATATSAHITVLEGVLQKAPEQAKSSIEGAIQKSEQGRTSATRALEERGLRIPTVARSDVKIAEDFVRNEATFRFDGMEETLKLVDTKRFSIAICPTCVEFTFEFTSRQGGYGNRTGQFLTQVLTDHAAKITMKEHQVTRAIMDDRWDMINQKPIIVKTYSESFENGLGAWTKDSYLECELQRPPCWPFEWSITSSTEQAHAGSYSLKGYLNGDHDDGTIWIERTVNVTPNSSADIEVNFYLRSDSKSDFERWPVLAYVGLIDPEKEEDFKIIGQTNEVAGWKQYSYSTQLTADNKGTVWVAVGFGATWENARTYYMDSVDVKIY